MKLVAHNRNEIGSILWHRWARGLSTGVNVPVYPGRRFKVFVELIFLPLRTPSLEVRVIADLVVTKERCGCGSGVMREPRFFGCAVCSIPSAPLTERALLYPGRPSTLAVCECAGPMVNTNVDGNGGHSPGCPARPARGIAA